MKLRSLTLLVLILFSVSCVKEVQYDIKPQSQYAIFTVLHNLTDHIEFHISKTLAIYENFESEEIQDKFDFTIRIYEYPSGAGTDPTSGTLFLEAINPKILVNNNYGIGRFITNIPLTRKAVIGNGYALEVTIGDNVIRSAVEYLPEPIPVKNSSVSSEELTFDLSFDDPPGVMNYYSFYEKYYIKPISEEILIPIISEIQFIGSNTRTDVHFSGKTNTNFFSELKQLEFYYKTPFEVHVESRLLTFEYEEYEFLRKLKLSSEQSYEKVDEESAGPFTLFSSPPVKLNGNLTLREGEGNKNVFGFFIVAGADSNGTNILEIDN